MQAASADVKGMQSGCITCFNQIGLSIGVALINLIDGLYLNAKWDGLAPTDDTCQSALFISYTVVYYEGYFVTCCIMAILGVAIVGFAIAAGTSAHEVGLKGFKGAKRAEILVLE